MKHIIQRNLTIVIIYYRPLKKIEIHTKNKTFEVSVLQKKLNCILYFADYLMSLFFDCKDKK